jgi:hypothetical protein
LVKGRQDLRLDVLHLQQNGLGFLGRLFFRLIDCLDADICFVTWRFLFFFFHIEPTFAGFIA